MPTAPLNISSHEPLLIQLTTASTVRDTAAPANAVLIGSGDATLDVSISGLLFEAVDQITEPTLIWIWESLDSGTTKRKIQEIMLEVNRAGSDADKRFPFVPANKEYWLKGTTHSVYATIYNSKKVNGHAHRFKW